MRMIKYFNKGRLSVAVIPVIFVCAVISFIALTRRVEIPIYFPGNNLAIILTAATSIAPLANALIAFLLSPSNPLQERLTIKKVSRLSTLSILISTLIMCWEAIPLGIWAFHILNPPSIHFDFSILAKDLPLLLTYGLLPTGVVILLFALLGRAVGAVSSLIYLIFTVFIGTIPSLSFITPLGDLPVHLRFSQFIFSVIVYAIAIAVWHITAASAPVLRLIDSHNF